MEAGFDPILTAVSLLAGVLGIGAGVGLALGRRDRLGRYLAGVVLGIGVTALHYLGQAAYVVTGTTVWNGPLVSGSVGVALAMFGISVVVAGERSRSVRRFGAPFLLASIAVLHFCGMTATSFFDPMKELPAGTLAPSFIVPIVAGVSLGLLALAVLGLRFTVAAKLRRGGTVSVFGNLPASPSRDSRSARTIKSSLRTTASNRSSVSLRAPCPVEA